MRRVVLGPSSAGKSTLAANSEWPQMKFASDDPDLAGATWTFHYNLLRAASTAFQRGQDGPSDPSALRSLMSLASRSDLPKSLK